jgi:hypothetical protein
MGVTHQQNIGLAEPVGANLQTEGRKQHHAAEGLGIGIERQEDAAQHDLVGFSGNR